MTNVGGHCGTLQSSSPPLSSLFVKIFVVIVVIVIFLIFIIVVIIIAVVVFGNHYSNGKNIENAIFPLLLLVDYCVCTPTITTGVVSDFIFVIATTNIVTTAITAAIA